MKKWAWLLVMVIVISCTSEAIAYSKRLSHPLVLEVTIDHDFQNLYVSYLTNRQKPTIMQSVTIGDRTLYPQNSRFSFMAEPAQPNSFKDYTYYSIYSELISLNINQKPGIHLLIASVVAGISAIHINVFLWINFQILDKMYRHPI